VPAAGLANAALAERRALVPQPPRFAVVAAVVAAKDMRIEASARVATSQVLPFAGIVLLMFAFASDPDRSALRGVAPGMFWTSIVLAAVLAASRSAAVEVQNAASDGVRMSAADPGAVFLGKAAAVLVQLLLLEAALLMGLVTVYGFHVEHPAVLVLSAVTASIGIAAAGVLYATIAASLRVRDTLVPLLMLPALAPVALGGTRAWVAAQAVGPGDGLRWVQLLAVFASLFTAFGIAAYGSLIEEG
jgi:heme exporter protein B